MPIILISLQRYKKNIYKRWVKDDIICFPLKKALFFCILSRFVKSTLTFFHHQMSVLGQPCLTIREQKTKFSLLNGKNVMELQINGIW